MARYPDLGNLLCAGSAFCLMCRVLPAHEHAETMISRVFVPFLLLSCNRGKASNATAKSSKRCKLAWRTCEENNCLIDTIAKALSYDVQVYDIMQNLSYSNSSTSSDAERDAELRTSKCLQAAWSTRSVQHLLTCPDMQQLLQQFQQLSADVVQLNSQPVSS